VYFRVETVKEKEIKTYERNLQIECLAIIRVKGCLYCSGCGQEISKEYTEKSYHHPLCWRCRLDFTKIAREMEHLETLQESLSMRCRVET